MFFQRENGKASFVNLPRDRSMNVFTSSEFDDFGAVILLEIRNIPAKIHN